MPVRQLLLEYADAKRNRRMFPACTLLISIRGQNCHDQIKGCVAKCTSDMQTTIHMPSGHLVRVVADQQVLQTGSKQVEEGHQDVLPSDGVQEGKRKEDGGGSGSIDDTPG